MKRASYEGEAALSSGLSFSYDVGRKRGARHLEDTKARHAYPGGKGDPEYIKQRDAMAANYTSNLKRQMISIDSIRQQLLSTIPEEVRGAFENEQLSTILKNGIAGQTLSLDDARRLIAILNNLLRRISELPPLELKP